MWQGFFGYDLWRATFLVVKVPINVATYSSLFSKQFTTLTGYSMCYPTVSTLLAILTITAITVISLCFRQGVDEQIHTTASYIRQLHEAFTPDYPAMSE